MTSRLGKEKNSENLAGTQARYGQHLQDLCGRDGWHSQDQHAIRQYRYTSANLLQSRPAGTMDVWRHRASNGRASPVYQPWGPWLFERGGQCYERTLDTPLSPMAQWLGGGIFYYIIPPSHLHSSVALLSLIYLIYTNIAPILILTISINILAIFIRFLYYNLFIYLSFSTTTIFLIYLIF